MVLLSVSVSAKERKAMNEHMVKYEVTWGEMRLMKRCIGREQNMEMF